MEREFAVMLGGEKIGKVMLDKEGLYYRLRCSCRLSGQVLCRLVAVSEAGELDLGTLVPDRGTFGMDTRVPVKKIGTGKLSFRAEPKHAEVTGVFVPIRPEEPFGYLTKLTNAYLQCRSGQAGIVITE